MDFYPALHNVSKEDKDFITRDLDESNENNGGRSNISLLLYKIFVGTTILDLSSETRFLSFIIFYRYLCEYRIHYTTSNTNKTATTTTTTSAGTSAAVAPGTSTTSSNDECLSHPQKHLGKIAAAALFLACKITNENRRIRDVINVYHILNFSQWSGSFPSSTSSTSCNSNSKKKTNNKGKYCQGRRREGEGETDTRIILNCRNGPPPLDESYWSFKEEIVKTEHHLLRVLNFDVHNMVISPYRIVVSIIEQIINLIVGDGLDEHDLFQQILKHAWRRINDAIFHIDAMAMKNSDLACGALILAFEEVEAANKNDKYDKVLEHINFFCWWQWVNVTLQELNMAKAKLTEATEILSSLRINGTGEDM